MPAEISISCRMIWATTDADAQRCEGCDEPIYFPHAWRPILLMLGEKIEFDGFYLCDSCMDAACLPKS